jgi:hypothetical protein
MPRTLLITQLQELRMRRGNCPCDCIRDSCLIVGEHGIDESISEGAYVLVCRPGKRLKAPSRMMFIA